MKKIIIFAVLLLFTISTFVNAQSTALINDQGLTPQEQQQLDARTDIVREYFLSIAKEKASLEKLKEHKMLESNPIFLSILEDKISNAEANLANLRESYADYGLIKVEKVEKTDLGILSSSPGDYTISDLQIFYDPSIGKFLLHSGGHFTNDNWKLDANIQSVGWSNLGGYDGYGLFSMHEDIITYNPEFHTLYYKDPTGPDGHIDWTNIAGAHPHSNGYAWTYQDEIYKASFFSNYTDYNNWWQLGYYYFDFVYGIPSHTVGFRASFAHTWDVTSINGISYPGGVSWINEGHSWSDGRAEAFNFSDFLN